MLSSVVTTKRNFLILGILGVFAIVAAVAVFTLLFNRYLPIECNFDWCVPKV